jgi:hypothetical protein
VARRKQPKARLTEHQFMLGGIVIGTPAAPWCDCEKPEWNGLTRREDGIWVRACCMRRTKHMFDLYGDDPVPPTVPLGERIGAAS